MSGGGNIANPEHLAILGQGVEAWNQWRRAHPDIEPDLYLADLRGADLTGFDLSDANLRRANLRRATLSKLNLSSAFVSGADLGAAFISETNLSNAFLDEAYLWGAYLLYSVLQNTSLEDVELSEARIGGVSLVEVDLSRARGLETVRHDGPSFISIDTLYLSGGNIPEVFLRGCGVPDDFITFMHSLTNQAAEYFSCFISYSHQDEAFAQHLHAQLQQAGLRVWYAPEDMRSGQKIHEQIDHAIHQHDRLLLVLSEASMASEWVQTEIAQARQREVKEKRRMLFPISLAPFDLIKEWKCFDGDTGKDMAREIREYFIRDFSNWQSPTDFQNALARLLQDLRSEQVFAEGATDQEGPPST